jgi:putative acetyltransferase
VIAIDDLQPEDRPALAPLLLAAFGPAEGPEIVVLTDALMSDPSAEPRHALAARDGGQLVGMVILSHARLEGAGAPATVSLLAPLAVTPERHAQGIGSRLVRAGFARLTEAGVPLVFTFGDPAYYGRFGFEPAMPRGLQAPHPIQDEHRDAWVVHALAPDALASAAGKLACAESIRDPRYWRV